MIELNQGADGVAQLALARPPVNALDLSLVRAIDGAVANARASGALALVITGNGSCFSAGIDMKVAPTYDERQRGEATDAIDAMVATIASAPMPVVAAVNGHAFGGGLVIALACDLRLGARADYRLALNEVAAGVPFPDGPLAVVRSELDPSVLRELCLTGRSLAPEEARSLRVLDEIVDPQALLALARERALTLASMPAYPVVKAQVRAPLIAALERIAARRERPMAAPESGPWEASPSEGPPGPGSNV